MCKGCRKSSLGCSPEARLRACRLADWGPTPETPAGHPHLKPQVGEHLEQRPAAPPTGPKQRTQCRVTQSQSGPALQRDSSPKRLDWLINRLAACQGPHLQRLPNTYAQSPAGPTASLGQRQNTQQRGAAGLGETAFPGKTQPNRGLNYSIAAPRTSSI